MPSTIRKADPAGVGHRILVLRGQRVLLDADLAELYGVPTKALNQAVRRNVSRFPADFMLKISASEWTSLRSQIVTLNVGRGQHRKYPPVAFTEYGAFMAAAILNTPRAIRMSVYVVRVRTPAGGPRLEHRTRSQARGAGEIRGNARCQDAQAVRGSLRRDMRPDDTGTGEVAADWVHGGSGKGWFVNRAPLARS